MSRGFDIVALEEQHTEALRSVVDGVAREERYLTVFTAFPIEDTRRYVAESLKKRRPVFLALAGADVVGWCDILEKARDALLHSGVLGLGVDRAYRGRGIGGALLERTLADARAKGFTRIELIVRADNHPAKRLYEKFGFAVEGLCRRHMRVRGEYFDSYLMALLYD